MDLREYLRAVRVSWWVVLLVTVLGLGAGVLKTEREAPTYAGHVTFYVRTPAPVGNNSNASNQTAAEDLAVSYAQLLSSDRLGAIIARSDRSIGLNGRQVASRIAGAASLNTVLISATVQDSSRARLAAITDGVAREFPTMIRSLNSSVNQPSLEVTSGPHVGSAPVAPRKKTEWGLGLLLGLLVGLALAVLRAAVNTSVTSAETATELTGAAVLGGIPFDSSTQKNPVLHRDAMRSVRAEAYRKVRTSIEFMNVSGPLQVIVVTSALAAEGKSVSATNLGLMFAETRRSVLLIEADLRRPRDAEYLGMEGGVGLSDVLIGRAGVSDVIQQWGDTSMSLLSGGTAPPNPAELLGSGQMTELLEEVRGRFDVVILDTPPLGPVTDAAVLATMADGVVVVTRHGKTKRNQLRAATQALDAVGARVIGVIMNMVPVRGPYGDTYGRYGDYGSTAQEPPPANADTRTNDTETMPPVLEEVGVESDADPVVATRDNGEKTALSRARRTRAGRTAQSAHPPRRRRSPERVAYVAPVEMDPLLPKRRNARHAWSDATLFDPAERASEPERGADQVVPNVTAGDPDLGPAFDPRDNDEAQSVERSPDAVEMEPVQDAEVEPVQDAEVEPAQDAEVEPAQDAGVEPAQDAGVEPAQDAGVEPAQDAGVEPAQDAEVEPAQDAGVEPAQDAGVEPAQDAGVEPVQDAEAEESETPSDNSADSGKGPAVKPPDGRRAASKTANRRRRNRRKVSSPPPR